MAYLVDLTARAIRDLDFLYRQINASESTPAARWYNGLESAIASLDEFPLRYPTAPESRTAGRPLRHLMYGRRNRAYRVIYEVDEGRKTVSILTIRHWARDEATPEEL